MRPSSLAISYLSAPCSKALDAPLPRLDCRFNTQDVKQWDAMQVRVGEQTQITNVLWQSVNPEWEEALFFREICAASELVVEVSSVKPIYCKSPLIPPGIMCQNSPFFES